MTRGGGSWGGRLFLAPGLALYLGQAASADRHAHNAVQLVWAPGGCALQLPGRTVAVRAGLVPAGLQHGVEAHAGAVALMLVERHGARGAALDTCARQLVGAELSGRLGRLGFPALALSPAAALAWCDAVLAELTTPVSRPHALSRPVRLAVEYVEGALEGTPRLGEAARRGALSTTRLTHRFSVEVGIPFRRFVLWARVKRAVEATRRGGNATEAAVAAGFSDSAHLSRTFRAMFGLPPSLVLPTMEIIDTAWASRDRNVQAGARSRS